MIGVKALAEAIAAEMGNPGAGPTEEQFKRTKVEQARAAVAARRALRRQTEQARRSVASNFTAPQRTPEPQIPTFITAFGHTFPTGVRGKESEFLDALTKLCRLYGFTISGCGCCGSPYLNTLEPDEMLIGYTNENDGQLEPRTRKLTVGERMGWPEAADEGLGIGLRSSKRDY